MPHKCSESDAKPVASELARVGLRERKCLNNSYKKTGHQDRFFVFLHPPSKTSTWDQNSIGAGEGNRTLVISLGSWSNAIIRHPLRAADFVPDVRAEVKFFFVLDGFSSGDTP